MISFVVGEIGSKTLMYASDYPHWDMSWPESGAFFGRAKIFRLTQKRTFCSTTPNGFTIFHNHYGRLKTGCA